MNETNKTEKPDANITFFYTGIVGNFVFPIADYQINRLNNTFTLFADSKNILFPARTIHGQVEVEGVKAVKLSWLDKLLRKKPVEIPFKEIVDNNICFMYSPDPTPETAEDWSDLGMPRVKITLNKCTRINRETVPDNRFKVRFEEINYEQLSGGRGDIDCLTPTVKISEHPDSKHIRNMCFNGNYYNRTVEIVTQELKNQIVTWVRHFDLFAQFQPDTTKIVITHKSWDGVELVHNRIVQELYEGKRDATNPHILLKPRKEGEKNAQHHN